MKRSAYNGFLGTSHVIGVNCYKCGGMKKKCYRWREQSHWLYKIMPCHACSHSYLKSDPDFHAYLEESETWVDIPLDQQRARFETEAAQRAAALAEMRAAEERFLRRMIPLPQNPTEPARQEVNEDVDDEA